MQLAVKYLLSTALLMCLSLASGIAQYNEKGVIVQFSNKTMAQCLDQLSSESGISILFSPNFFKDMGVVDRSYDSQDPEYILQDLLEESTYGFQKINGKYVISRKKEQLFHLYGMIRSADSGERLPYATIVIAGRVHTSDAQGYYNILLAGGDTKIEISYIGHETLVAEMNLKEDTFLDHFLPTSSVLPEVVIDERNMSVPQHESSKYGHEYLMELSQKTPGIGGSNDLLQTAKSIAGVQSGAGGIGGYFVRGGSNDQNLFLLDGVAIYNPFHSLGMSSIFTPQMTQSFQVITSGFRAQYGDRSSSVLDIRLKDGNRNNYAASAGINPQDGFIKLEGPLSFNKASFFVYGRSSTTSFKFNDIIRRSLFPGEDVENNTDYFDLIAKLAFEITPKSKIYATFFKSKDLVNGAFEETAIENGIEIESTDESNLSWGNQIFNLRWQRILSSDAFLNISLSHNQYFSRYGIIQNEENSDQELEDFYFGEVSSVNNDIEFKLDVDFVITDKWRLKSGMGVLLKKYLPEVDYYDEESEELEEVTELNFGNVSSIAEGEDLNSSKIYHYSEFSFSDGQFLGHLGLRTTYFSFADDHFFDFQPRLNLEFGIAARTSIFASLSRTVQYAHLLSSSEVHLPRDLWYPSSGDLLPERSWHTNVGIRKQLSKYSRMQVEAYHRSIRNKAVGSLEPINDLQSIGDLFSSVGDSRSIGIESTITINKKRWQGTWAYVFSKSDNLFPNLNLGVRFDFQFDRRHEIKTIHSLELLPSFFLGFSGYLASGHPILVTDNLDANMGLIPVDINPIGQKNKIRTGMQHRFDLSLTYTWDTWKLTHSAKLNLYNVYNNSLPLFYTESNSGILLPEFSVPFLPSLTYILKFQ